MAGEAGEEGPHTAGGSSGGNGEEGASDADRPRSPSSRRRSTFTNLSGEVDDEEIEEVLEMFSFDELRHRKAVYVEAVKRKEAAERVMEDDDEEADEMQRARSQRGRPRRVLSNAEKRKRTLAAEQQILKLFQRMSNKYGVTAWVFGYTTSIGKPRIGAAESVQPWWVLGKVYELNAIRAHVAGRGELQQEINRLEGSALNNLLQKLNGPQLHSLAAFWFPKCDPSIRKFPLSGEKGSPPWWPADSRFRKVSLMKNEPLREVMLAALENICISGQSSAATVLKLEEVFAACKLLRNESARVRAIVHSIINCATALWQPQQDSATAGAEEARSGGAETGQEGANNSDTHEAVGAEEPEAVCRKLIEADSEWGFVSLRWQRWLNWPANPQLVQAGVPGRRKRRRQCDITEYPFKCTAAGCEGHRGFVSAGGLANHRRANHPGASRGATEATTAGGGLGGAADAAASTERRQPHEDEDPNSRPTSGEANEETERGPRTESATLNQPANEAGGGHANLPRDPETVPLSATQGDPGGAGPPRDSSPMQYGRRRKASLPRWTTSRRTAGARKGKAKFEEIRRRVLSASSPSLEGMKDNHGHVFLAHQTGTRKGEYIGVHYAPHRVLDAIGQNCGLNLVGFNLDDKRAAIDNLYWTRYYDELIDNRRTA